MRMILIAALSAVRVAALLSLMGHPLVLPES
jgi:hypothetical protein